jgi:hypothetical protein
MPPRADAPALAGRVARPDERDRAQVGRRGAKAPDHGVARDGRLRQVLESDPVKNVLAGRQALHKRLGGEIALRQRIDEYATADVLERVGGGEFDLHAGRTIGARPHHSRVDRHVAGLHPVADLRPIARAADRGAGDGADGAGGRRGLEESSPRDQGRPQDGWLPNDAHSALLIRPAKPHDGREF